jgi:26S proteasome regulatory subunit N5
MTNENIAPLMKEMEHLDPLVKDPKATEDYSATADSLIPKAESLAKAGRINEAIEELLALEKKARFAFDGITCSRLICSMASMYYHSGDFAGLCELIPSLIKKRGQLKRPVSDLINLCMKWLKEGISDRGLKYSFIQVLGDVTEGKIYVEAERARIKLYESQLKESEGKVDEACLILQEEQVEIIGAMEARERTEYILEQMRLVLLRNDYIRLPIIAKKINPKILNADESLKDLKLRYYEYLILHYLHEEDYVEVSNCYNYIIDTSLDALVGNILGLLLSPLCDKQLKQVSDLLVKEKRRFDDIPQIRDLARAFLEKALIRTVDPAIKAVGLYFGESQLHADRGIPSGASRLALLQKRIVQFNLVKVLSAFYSRIRLPKLAMILGLSVDQCEIEITELVANKALQLKIDRPAGIVWFHPRLSPQSQLDKWAGNINRALDLVESTSNLIQKEIMLHSAKEKVRAQIAKDRAAMA